MNQNEGVRISQNIPIQLNFNLNNLNSVNYGNSILNNNPIQEQLITTPKQKNQFTIDIEPLNHPQSEPQPQLAIPQQYQHTQDMFGHMQSAKTKFLPQQSLQTIPHIINNDNQYTSMLLQTNNTFQQNSINAFKQKNSTNIISQENQYQQNGFFKQQENELNNIQSFNLFQNVLQQQKQSIDQSSLQNELFGNTMRNSIQPNINQPLFPGNENFLQSMEINHQFSQQKSVAPNEYFQSNSKNLQDIQKQHDRLIQQILQQEELLIKTHKSNIDQNVSLTHQDMQILHEVDQPGSDIEKYLTKLEHIMIQKQNQIDSLKNVVNQFRSMMKVIQKIQQEEALSYTFYQKRNEQMQIEVQDFSG